MNAIFRSHLRAYLSLAIALNVLFAGFAGHVQASPTASCEDLLAGSDPSLVEAQKLRHELQEKLGVFQDPFLFDSNVEQTVATWNKLLENYPHLRDLQDAVYECLKQNKPFDKKLEKEVLAKAKELLDSGEKNSYLIAAVIEALRKIELVHIHNLPTPPPPKGKKEGKDNKKNENKPQPPPPPQPPSYPQLSKKYQAHNKDTEGSDNDEKRVPIASVNARDISYWRAIVYQFVDATSNEWGQVAITRPQQVLPTQISLHTVKLHALGDKGAELPVLIPQGFIPQVFESKDGKVFQDESGNFYFIAYGETLEVPVLPQGLAARPLSPSEIEIYTTPSGVKFSDWPEDLQNAVINLKEARARGGFQGPQGDVELAQVLGSFIANHFKYRVDKDPPASAPELAKRRAFQCDTSVTILVSLLRDEFQIPSRPVGGFTGVRDKTNPSESHVVSPAQAHAWAEIADKEGNWHGVDATPHTKDRETKPQSNKDSFEDINRSSESKDKIDPNNVDGVPQDNSKDAGKDLKALIDEEVKRQLEKKKAQEDEAKKNGEKSSGKEEGKTKGEKSAKEATPPQHHKKVKTDELLEKLEQNNPYVVRLVKRLFLWALDPQLPLSEKANRINALKAKLGTDTDAEANFPAFKPAKSLLSEATLIFAGTPRPAFLAWLETVLSQTSQKPINETVEEILQIQHQLEFTMKFMDPSEKQSFLPILDSVNVLRRALSEIKHPDSKAIRIAEELFKNLAGNISRRVLWERFHLKDSLGDDVATLDFAKAISNGKLNDFRLSSILGPHTEFVVDPIHTPSRGERKTWQRALRKQKGRHEILMTSDPRDHRGFVRLNPHLTDEQALIRGEMGVVIQRRKIQYPTGIKDTDPEKATVIAIDTSGSMSGDPAYFQTQYVGALVDRALSDVNPNGKARHRVYILAFDTEVHDVIEVTSPKEAIALLQDLKNRTSNTAGGTDIQAALLKAAQILKKASVEGNKALSRANVVLASDGGSSVSIPEIKKAFDDVGRDTDILLSFVAINGTNPDLVALVDEGKKLGVEKSLYIEWSPQDISRLIAESQAKPEPISDFWTKTRWDELPTNVIQAFMGVGQAIVSSRSNRMDLVDNALQRLQEQLRTFSRKERNVKRDGSSAGKLMGFRRALNHIGATFSPMDRARILNEVLLELNAMLSEPFETLDHSELAEFHHILSWPAAGVASK